MVTVNEFIENGGFEYECTWITDMYLDESGRFEVNPAEYYNITL
jgi:hypothetical protein